MSVIRIKKTKNYVVMSNYHLKERKMSLKAKGLLSLMLSLPDNWDYSIEGLVTICSEGITAIRTTLKELQTFGYLEVKKLYADNTKSGRIEYEYTIYENPKIENQDAKKQDIENLYVENNIQYNNKELSINKETNISINTNISKNSKTPKNNCIEKTKPLIDTNIDKKKKKAEAIKEIFYMTESFSSNDDVVKTLKEYLKFRLNRGLQINQWKLILDDLKNYTKTDNEKIQKINNAIAGGYMQFIPSWEKDKKTYSKFDNATDSKADSIVGMNKEQKDNFINRLNKDADGRLKGY